MNDRSIAVGKREQCTRHARIMDIGSGSCRYGSVYGRPEQLTDQTNKSEYDMCELDRRFRQELFLTPSRVYAVVLVKSLDIRTHVPCP